MYKITYKREGQKSKCTYQTIDAILFEKYLQELKADKTVKILSIKQIIKIKI